VSDTLQGSVRLVKRLRQNAIWQRKDYGWAWVDMLLLANDRPRTVFLNGIKIDVRRGQLAWSLAGLAKEWDVSREWVEAFMIFCQDQGLIKRDTGNNRKPIITILNYEAYNPLIYSNEPADATIDEPADATAVQPANEPARKREEGTRKGKGEAPPANFSEYPNDSEVEEFCRGFEDLERGVHGIPEIWWRGWLAAALTRQTFPADWKRAIRNAFLGDFASRHPKALGQGFEDGKKNGNGVWAATQKLELLKKRAAEHPANEGAAAYCGDPTEDQWHEFEKLKLEIQQCEEQITGVAA